MAFPDRLPSGYEPRTPKRYCPKCERPMVVGALIPSTEGIEVSLRCTKCGASEISELPKSETASQGTADDS